MKQGWSAVVTAVAVIAALLGLPAAASADEPEPATSLYVVLLARPPLATYSGSIPGYPATTVEPGDRFDATRSAVTRYRDYLRDGQQRILDSLGDPETVYSYTTAVNGFAAMLTLRQVQQLQASHGVLTVQPSHTVQPAGLATATGSATPSAADHGTDTDSSQLLDLAGRHGAWHQVGGIDEAGKGEVIGVVGTGIWPENPSFDGLPLDRSRLHRALPGFTGTCEPGEHWSKSTCNSKVIAARYFSKGFQATHTSGIARADVLSPRDINGHGSHVAALAAGNNGVDVHIAGQDFGHVSGVAPQARLSIYKACWAAPDPDRDGCSTADALKAVDQAVADGVDVLNYSLGTPSDVTTSVLSLALLNATAAGVFVAVPAGNGGPAADTVTHTAPWVTTVGASTYDLLQGGVRLGNGRVYIGAMLSGHSVGPAPLVYAGDAAAPGVSDERAALCYSGSLNAAKVDGAIVVCDRGSIARVAKSAAVARAGGIGMVLVNIDRHSTDPDSHSVPTVHVSRADGEAIKAYVDKAGADATARLDAGATQHVDVPQVARFSGRGPTASGDVLKPDLSAPGADVIGATSPQRTGELWGPASGTSFATADVAGLAALLASAHPSWTPDMTKSALVTTATPVSGRDDSPWAQGAGVPDAKAALDPGLVYEADHGHWMRYLSAQGFTYTDGRPVAQQPLAASDVNLPSIAVNGLLASESVTRTVTNVTDHTETYTASVHGLRGIQTTVRPDSLTLKPGESATFTAQFTATKKSTYGVPTTGTLTWTGTRHHTVTSPIVVTPALVGATTDVTGHGQRGTVTLTPVAGVTGTLHPQAVGMVAAEPVQFSLGRGDFDPSDPQSGPNARVQTYRVPKNTAAVRFATQASTPNADLDLYVYRGDDLVATAAGSGSREVVTLPDPKPGTYRAFVTSVNPPSGKTSAELTGWVVPQDGRTSTAAASLSVKPRPVTVTGGESFKLTASWSGLDPSKRWLGFITYRDAPVRTYLTVN